MPKDDTPRSFTRLMEYRDRAKEARSARKKSAKTGEGHSNKDAPSQTLKIRKGESMADFSRRVDEAISLPKARPGIDSRKLQKYSKKQRSTAENLRKEYEQRLNKRRSAQEEDDDDGDALPEDDGEDVWAHLKARDKKPSFGEVADRPPELPRLKPRGGVPKSAGSLARREMLEQERNKVLEFLKKKRESSNG